MTDKELCLTVGSKIKKLRMSMGFSSATNFALVHGIPHVSYHRWERGLNMKLDSLNKILNIHGLTMGEFMEV